MKKPLLTYLKKLFSDLHAAIIGIVVGSLFVGGLGIYIFFRNLWNWLIDIMLLQTPVWVTIVLFLALVLYVYIITRNTQSYRSPRKNIIKYFTIGKYTWKTDIDEYGNFEVDEYPFCPKHDLQFIFDRYKKYCPGNEIEKCDNEIRDSEHFHIFEKAKSIIESKVRNKNY